MSLPATAAPQTTPGLAMALLWVFVFLIYSRILEAIGYYVGNLHLGMILMCCLMVASFLGGSPFKILASPPAAMLALFTGWAIVCMPMGVWPGGSYKTLVDEWLPSFVTFFVTAQVVSTVKDSQRLASSMAAGVVAIYVSYLLFGNQLNGYRVESTIGTLGNPNLFALQLLMGMPFCIYMVYKAGLLSLKGGFYVVISIICLYLVVSTGSRSGLIALGLGYILLLLRASVMGKFGLLSFVFLGLLAAVAVLPRVTLTRYMTTFSSDESLAAGNSEIQSAIDSANARRYHLLQSIKLTFSHPIFGVGPGQFKVAAADLSRKSNENAAWLETHNSWTQVSSETGFPGIILYLGAVLYCVKRLWSQYRLTRKDPNLRSLADLTFCMLLSFPVSMVAMTFASAAYQTGLPLLCGLAVGLLQVSKSVVAEARQAAALTAAQPAFVPRVNRPVSPLPTANRF